MKPKISAKGRKVLQNPKLAKYIVRNGPKLYNELGLFGEKN